MMQARMHRMPKGEPLPSVAILYGTKEDPRRVKDKRGRQDWKALLASILKQHGIAGAKTGRRLSTNTLDKRSDVLYLSFQQLHELGFKMYDPWHFRGKHFQALVTKWEEEGIAPATLQNRISILRVFSEWIGKAGMIGPSHHYVKDKASVTRKTATDRDKSWQGQGIDVEKLIHAVSKIDYRVSLQLKLMHAFGARCVESIAFKPKMRDHDSCIELIDQTKGGQRRFVPVDTDYQRSVLEECKGMVRGVDSHMGRVGKTLKQEVRHFYHILEKVGITGKDLGITSHGLRHGFLNDYYEKISGTPSPVRQTDSLVKPDPELDKIARHKTSVVAGHMRTSITTAYTGSPQSVKKPRGRPPKEPEIHIPKRGDAQADLFVGGGESEPPKKKRKTTAMNWNIFEKK